MCTWCTILEHRTKKIPVLYRHCLLCGQRGRKFSMMIFGMSLIRFDIYTTFYFVGAVFLVISLS